MNDYSISEDIDVILSYNFTFGPQLEYPRKEAIERIVTNCLYTLQETYPEGASIETIREKMRNECPVQLRTSQVSSSIESLLKKDIILSNKQNGRDYFLIKEKQKIKTQINERGNILNRCVEKIITRIRERYSLITSSQINTVSTLFKEFIVFVFSQIGQQSAKMMLGNFSNKDILYSSQINDKLNQRLSFFKLTNPELISVIKTEFYNFFQGSDPVYSSLKFYMTQNFYILKLLGIDPKSRVLSKNAFNNSYIYLDSNVIITGLLSEAEMSRSFQEFYKISQDIGISLYVSEVTKKEIKDVIKYQRGISDTYDNIPTTMEDQIHNAFYEVYKKSKEKDPTFTIDKLFEPFEDLENTLKDKFKICIEDDILYDTILKDKDIERIKNILQKKSKEIRKKEKKDGTLLHDAFLFLLIKNKREEKSETWFLTLDTSLPPANKMIFENEANPSCFTLDSWLQCISPFVPENSIENFSSVFSGVLGSEFFSFEQIYDIEDFKFWTDIEVDIKKWPESIIREYTQLIKNEIRKGRPYNEELKKELTYKLSKKLNGIEERFSQEKITNNNEDEKKALTESVTKLTQALKTATIRAEASEKNLQEEINKMPDTVQKEVKKILDKKQEERRVRVKNTINIILAWVWTISVIATLILCLKYLGSKKTWNILGLIVIAVEIGTYFLWKPLKFLLKKPSR
ncbi:MAG: hypothetical protein WC614_05520 [bacterium]